MKPSVVELFDLKNKVAIVTGAGVGIGAQIALRLAHAGACAAVVDVDHDRADRSTQRINAAGGIASPFVCDVGDVGAIHRTVEGVVRALGRVDVLINNAGIFPLAPALDVTEQSWDRVHDVNLKGAFFFAQAAAQQMIRQGEGGSIVNIASIDGLHPTGMLAHYDASKGGMIMMTRSLALELAPQRIRVNTIAPGAIKTPGADAALGAMAGPTSPAQVVSQVTARIPMGRMGDPDDIACAALFFASRASSYVTGSTLVVDGGYLLG